VPKKLISIIGSNSFLAINLISLLRRGGHVIHGYARNDDNYGLVHFREFDYPKIKLEIAELMNSDVIIFAAGNGIQSNRKANDLDILELNTFYPIEIITALSNMGYKGQFFSFGSYAEIGVTDLRTPFVEDDVIYSNHPVHNQYSVSKRLLTNFVNNAILRSGKFYHLILPTIYGEGENPKRLIPYLVDCHKNNTIAHLTEGSQVRQYLHVVDASKYIKAMINCDNIEPGIYNLGSLDIYSVKEIVEMVKESCLPKLKVGYGNANRTDTMMNYIANNDCKLRSIISVENMISLTQGIQGYIQ